MEKMARFVPAGSNKVPLSDAYEAFTIRCKARNLSPGTLGWYKSRLGLFLAFLESKGVAQAREITPHLIRLYFDKMRTNHMSSGLIARDYGAFKCFLRFLSQERLIPQNPITLVEKPRMERKLIRPFTIEQVRLLLSKINQKRFEGFLLWTVAVLAELRRRGQASATVFGAYGAIRCAFRFWHREGLLTTNPMALVERPRRERVLIRPMSPDQASRLLDQPDAKTLEGLRDDRHGERPQGTQRPLLGADLPGPDGLRPPPRSGARPGPAIFPGTARPAD
jgi:site-specific recombinase XerD